MLVGGSPGRSAQPSHGHGRRGSTRAAINIQSIASTHLFGIAADNANSRNPASALPSHAHLILAGTIATQDPWHGVAIIADGGSSRVLRAVPSYDAGAGKLRGFRLYPGKNRTAFNDLGLRPGDLVTAINGATLDDPQRSQEIMNTIENSDQATVTLVRGTQVQDLRVNFAQVALEATNGVNSPPSLIAP